jgi:Ca2+-binding RTX toxin-like protein/subtilisin-like proprotein convertase family protein
VSRKFIILLGDSMAIFTVTNATGITGLDSSNTSQGVDFYGLFGKVVDVSVTLTGLTHTFTTDIDMLLVAPDGTSNLNFWSDVGGSADGAGAGQVYTISDSGTGPIAATRGVVLAGNYQPTAFGSTEFDADFGSSTGGINFAGPDGAATFGSAFGGADTAGIWTLFVLDDAGADPLSLESWAVSLTTASNEAVIDGTMGDDTLLITATGADSGTYQLNGGAIVAFSGLEGLTFDGLDGDDSVIVDMSVDRLNLVNGVTFNGGSSDVNGDKFEIISPYFDDVTISTTGADSGTLRTEYVGGAVDMTYALNGVEQVVSAINPDRTTFNLTAAANHASFEDNGQVYDGVSKLVSKDASFFDVTFIAPAVELKLLAHGNDTIDVDFSDPFTATDFTIGDIPFVPGSSDAQGSTDPALIRLGYVEALSVKLAAGKIEELNLDTGADVVAERLTVRAVTGIDVFETEVDYLAAQTHTGDITITNYGSMQIGDIDPNIHGVQVVESGSVLINNNGGNLMLAETLGLSLKSGATAGNVVAQNRNGDVTTPSGVATADSPNGSVTIISNFGSIDVGGAGGANHITAANAVFLGTTDNLTIGGSSVIGTLAPDTGSTYVQLLAYSDLEINGAAQIAADSGGDVYIEGHNSVTINTTATNAIDSQTSTRIFGDSIDLANAAITSDGTVAISGFTSGRKIVLDGPGSSSTLGLTSAELDQIDAAELVVGTTASGMMTGGLSLTDKRDVSLISGTDIVATSDIFVAHETVTGGNTLALRSGSNIHIVPGAIVNSNQDLRLEIDQNTLGVGATYYGAYQGASPGFINVEGNGDDDRFFGGIMPEYMNGGAGNDVFFGGSNNDTMVGGVGADTMTGGADDDVYLFETMAQMGNSMGTRDVITDFVQGEDLIDLRTFDALSSTPELDHFTWLGTSPHTGQGATLRYVQGAGKTLIYGEVDGNTAGDFTIELTGLFDLTADDFLAESITTIQGTNAGELLNGTNGAETLLGMGGNDTINGLDGNDTLNGGAGADLLSGGGNNFNNIFDFDSVSDIGNGFGTRDIIADFAQGFDKIDLADIDAMTGTPGVLDHFTWLGTGAHTGQGATLRYAQSAGRTLIYGDVDGDGSGDFTIELTGVHPLLSSDFTDATIAAIQGTAGDDFMDGTFGSDVLLGVGGADSLFAFGGEDTLDGGAGADGLFGGADADIFTFASVSDIGNAMGSRDIIGDFDLSDGDQIDLSRIDALTTTPGTLEAVTWLGTAAHTGEGATIRYVQRAPET